MNTYDPAELYEPPKKKGKKKGFVIFLLILAVVLAVGIWMKSGIADFLGDDQGDYSFNEDYIGILEIHGTMYRDGSDVNYNQEWILERIDQMMGDTYNRGLMLSIDTPGGDVYATDEVYGRIRKYQADTGRPVYAYMESMAASGGYYISAPADKIYANRNCWTGSIGVTIGTIVDVSEFLEKHGVKTVTITAGENKAMGSAVEPLTVEQRKIYQGLVDEAYAQFVDVVATGREMNPKQVEKLADGRIYTAKQAKENGLIDEIGTREEALMAMKENHDLLGISEEVMAYTPDFSLNSFLMGLTQGKGNEVKSEYDQIMKMLGENQQFSVSYISAIGER